MVKKRRTLDASDSQVTQFRTKALQYRKAMDLSYDSRLWDAAVSNAPFVPTSLRHLPPYN